MAAVGLSLKDHIISILTYIDKVELDNTKINERKSDWIFDIIESENIFIEREKFPNLSTTSAARPR